ncbi:hypothetical protein CXK91_21835 [Stutzerimonas stutzeri]|uniref:Uncharacterized protein n=1 Tax=Stutzerimonas stutzeri TaxID=316 RepID=A0A2S4AHR1_STUST|nr:hypothetical protein [Stutzerimonas stutzeri]MCQ4265529.1 hypothetical protein [Stutzerimonas stutzeri]POH80792.1 hypothetical protein CXK91_21835 [Stutzerimonas stutzeri]
MYSDNLLSVRDQYADALKRRLKQINKRSNDDTPLSALYDAAAMKVGYNNWSLFIKDLPSMSDARFKYVQDVFHNADVLAHADYDQDIDIDEFWFEGAGDY